VLFVRADAACGRLTARDRSAASGRTEDLVDASLLLGVGAPIEPAPAFVERIRQALQHEVAHVRSAGVTAVTFRAWPELKPLVEARRDDDDASVRARAEVTLQRWEDLQTPSV